MRSKSIANRCVAKSVRHLLGVGRHLRVLRNVDLATILTDNTERLLNLPGTLRFFPTQVSDASRVDSLIKKLHPIDTGAELVRFGPAGDGGYLVPNDLDGIVACFSPGVSNRCGFEVACARRGMQVFMADASVSGPPEQNDQFAFARKFIGANTSGEFISLEDWVRSSLPGPSGDLILQMDIEGYEYETLLSAAADLLRRFRIIVIEFHYLDSLFCAPLFQLYGKAFDRLLATHTCVHIHPNNVCRSLTVGGIEVPQIAEFTFLRNDRITKRAFAAQFPHPLDCDNTDKEPLVLPDCWYGGGKSASATA